jgi:putative DNA primase/helicase
MTTTFLEAPSELHQRRADARRYFRILDHARNALRTLEPVRYQYGGWEDLDDLTEWAIAQTPSAGDPANPMGVFVVINDVEESAFTDFANGRASSSTVGDQHIARRTEFYIDVDPARIGSDTKKCCATENERDWAEATMERVIMVTALHGFPPPMVVDSGNGFQIYYRVDLPADEESASLIKSVLTAVNGFVGCDRGKVDTSVGNASRLARVAGTYNCKGPHTADRPHRLCTIVSAPPDDKLELTSIDVLRAFVAAFASTEKAASESPGKTRQLDQETFGRVTKEIVDYLAGTDAPAIRSVDHDIDKTVITFVHCPFRGPGHDDGAAAVLQWSSGAIGFKCFHSKCEDQNWNTLQQHLGAQFQSAAMLDYAAASAKAIVRRFDDPLLLAESYYRQTQLADGSPTLAFIGGEMYRYLADAGWRPIGLRELHAPVREVIQRAFDADFLMKPDRKYPSKVDPAAVASTVKALESVAYHPVDPSTAPPFWLGTQSSNPLDLLVVRNGILDTRAWLEGREHLFPRTSQLFTDAVGQYEFDVTKVDAPEWCKFLDSLHQDDQWRSLLQQIMGACLCGGYDLQKIFMLVGPPRCGKGTIARVLEGLLGPQNVCSPNLVDFAKPFGLEQALGKRLAIVPEVSFPSRETHQIVATLKAISGGDLVTVDRKHIKNIPVRLPLKIMLATNNFVALPDNSKALPSRVIPLRFTESYLGKEDLTLKDKLAAERPAILNWSLEGLRQLHAQSGQFTLPQTSRDLMDQLQYESAPLQAFIQEVCGLDPRKGVYKQSLYEAYKKWHRDAKSDQPQLSTSDFNAQLMSAASQIVSKRPSNRDLKQSDYAVVPTDFDDQHSATRPEVWCGIFCR